MEREVKSWETGGRERDSGTRDTPSLRLSSPGPSRCEEKGRFRSRAARVESRAAGRERNVQVLSVIASGSRGTGLRAGPSTAVGGVTDPGGHRAGETGRVLVEVVEEDRQGE